MSILVPSLRSAVAVPGWAKNELWRKARAVPSLDLRFAENKSLSDAVTGQSLVTFTRASSGTYVGSDGLIKTATTDEPRFDHNPTTGESLGLLVEESRTNLLLRSEDFATTWGGAGTIDANTVVAPDGTLTADTITTATNAVKSQASQSFAAGSTLTGSVFAKKNVTNFLRFEIEGVVNCWYNLETGAVGTSTAGSGNVLFSAKSIQPYPNGWYRCILTLTTSTITTVSVLIYATTNDGQGLSGGESIHLWGAQLEVGSFPTSYIPTTTATVTRAADVASITGTNFNTAQFARASTATFYNSSGIITTANVDIPRNNYNPTTLVAEGLLLEPQRQNLLLHSEDVDQHTLSDVTSSLDATTAPDNATTADEIAPTATTAEHFVGYSATVTAGKTYTFSAYVKPNGAPAVRLRFALAGFNNEAGWHVFATNTTTPGGVGLRVIAIQNGWYRIEGTAVAAATALGSPRIYPNTVNGWLGVPAEAMYVWGAQLEEGPDATSYIPTTTTEVTRSADVPAVSPWYRQDEGTVYLSATYAYIASGVPGFARFDDGGNQERILLAITNGTQRFTIIDNGSEVADISRTGVTAGSNFAHAAAYRLNDVASVVNAGIPGTDISATIPTVNSLRFSRNIGGAYPNGAIRRLTYWPQRLPNSTLQTITQ